MTRNCQFYSSLEISPTDLPISSDKVVERRKHKSGFASSIGAGIKS